MFNDLTHITIKSSNAKVGPIPVTTTSASTCPTACPFNSGGGCYAASGPLKLHWDKVSRGERGTNWGEFCSTIESLPEGQLWRHNQAGDLPGNGDQIDRDAMASLVTANIGRKGFTYSHYDVERNADNRAIVFEANKWGFTVNVSGNNLAHADDLAALDIAPVVTVLPSEYNRTKNRAGWTESLTEYRDRVAGLKTPQGRTVAICPATYKDDVSCATCQLCAKNTPNRAIVGFPAHGTGKKRADAASNNALPSRPAIAAE